MGTVEPWNQKQIYFCCICKTGPGTQRRAIGRTCGPCGKLLEKWGNDRGVKPPKKPRERGITEESRRIYALKRKMFLRDNPFCEVELKLTGKKVPSTHVHHRKGRRKFYLDETTFVATTADGDRWIHANPEIAKKLGFLE